MPDLSTRPEALPPAIALGASTLPPVFPTLVHLFADAVARAPDREALVFEGRRLTYRQYGAAVAAFAADLAALGARGGRVALILGNGIETCIATFAVLAAGAQVVPLNPMYTHRELAFILRDAAPVALIHDAASADRAGPLATELGIAHVVAVGPGGRSLETADLDRALPTPLPDPAAPAILQYTGGTTGHPKGVDLSHGAVATNCAQREGLLPTRPDVERILCVMPIFHAYASSMCLHLAAACRGTLVILPRYRPDRVLDAIKAERITIFPGSPTLFIGLMGFEGFGEADFASLRISFSGASALPEEVLKRWTQATGCPVQEGFGQTEAGPVLAFNPAGGVTKPGSVGVPVPLTEIQIVDVDTGLRTLAVGEQGEIRARGPQLMTAYRNLPAETADTLRDGWLHTGDIGEIDRDGYLFVRDRKKDMAIVGGFNVYPREIDEVLHQHPHVAEAAAVGVPDSYRGEIIRALVVPRPGTAPNAEALLDHCRANLAKYKVPAAIEVVDAIPKTSVGKIDKKALRALLAGG